MPVFTYKAKKGPGDLVSGEIEASSVDQAVVKIEEMGLTPFRVEEKTAKITKGTKGSRRSREKDKKEVNAPSDKGLFTRGHKVKSKDMDAFTWQLASLVKANIPVLRALSLIAQQTESPVLHQIVSDLAKQIRDGKMLSEAMQKYPKLFNNLFLNMVKSGEQGGVLDEVLYKLAEYREKEQVMKNKIQSAMAYPMVMLVVGVGTVFCMFTFFLPKFLKIFQNSGQDLPVPTQILVAMSYFMSHYWYWIFIVLGLAWVVLSRIATGGKGKFVLDFIKLHIPFLKKFVTVSEIAKFARTLGLLLKNGLPVYESLALATDTLDNIALREPLSHVSDDIIQQGSTLSDSLAKANIFPSFAVNMIAVGEEGGRLEESLAEIANAYEREVDQAIGVMTSLLEPILILTIGGIVGFIVFAMLLPIFEIGVMSK